jgi:chromosome segregation ATPase
MTYEKRMIMKRTAKKTGDDDLDRGIKKLLDSLHGEEVDEKVEAKFNELRSEMESRSMPESDIAPLIAGMRELRDRTNRLESGMNRLENLCRKTEGIDQEKLWSTVQSEIDKLSSELTEQASKDRDRIEDLQSQLSSMKDVFKELRHIHEALKGVDVGALARDIESIKQKLSWIEQNQKPAGIDGLVERLEDVEAQLKGARLGSPLIIE